MDDFCLAQSLSAFGRLGAFERMWSEFASAQKQQPSLIDIGTLTIVCGFERRAQHRLHFASAFVAANYAES